MIVKFRIEIGWVYKDKIRVVINDGNQISLEFEDGSKEFIVTPYDKDKPNNPIYLLNDEGKTVERLH